jgi:hypothetical protein
MDELRHPRRVCPGLSGPDVTPILSLRRAAADDVDRVHTQGFPGPLQERIDVGSQG